MYLGVSRAVFILPGTEKRIESNLPRNERPDPRNSPRTVGLPDRRTIRGVMHGAGFDDLR